MGLVPGRTGKKIWCSWISGVRIFMDIVGLKTTYEAALEMCLPVLECAAIGRLFGAVTIEIREVEGS